MPGGLVDDQQPPPPPLFKTITVKPLHPTFGAEIQGVVDYAHIPEEQLDELKIALAKVRSFLPLSLSFSFHIYHL